MPPWLSLQTINTVCKPSTASVSQRFGIKTRDKTSRDWWNTWEVKNWSPEVDQSGSWEPPHRALSLFVLRLPRLKIRSSEFLDLKILWQCVLARTDICVCNKFLSCGVFKRAMVTLYWFPQLASFKTAVNCVIKINFSDFLFDFGVSLLTDTHQQLLCVALFYEIFPYWWFAVLPS